VWAMIPLLARSQTSPSVYKRSLVHWSADLSKPSAGLCKTWTAWGLLLEAASGVDAHAANSTYRYDLVNTGRELLAQLSTPLAINFSRAVGIMPPATGGKLPMDSAAIELTGSAYVQLLRDLDELVSTDSSFLLGPWLRDARAKGIVNDTLQTDCVGTVVDEALAGDCTKFHEWNARVQLTTWYPTPKGGPMPLRDHDYARKHWSPLIKDYYATRASLVLEQGLADAAAGNPLDAGAVLKFRTELAYNFTTSFVVEASSLMPAPGYVKVSAAMRTKYSHAFASCEQETARYV